MHNYTFQHTKAVNAMQKQQNNEDIMLEMKAE